MPNKQKQNQPTETESLQMQVDVLRSEMDKVLKIVDINAEAVTVDHKKNYNPDYLPMDGGIPRSLDELPERVI